MQEFWHQQQRGVGDNYITLVNGDITKQKFEDPKTAAIVNAANDQLWGGAGVALAIQNAAGGSFKRSVEAAMSEFLTATGKSRFMVGDALTTTAGAMTNVGWVIHTAGPELGDSEDFGNNTSMTRLTQKQNKEALLTRAYQNTLQQADINKIMSVAFTAISTGIFNYDVTLATPVAIATVLVFLINRPTNIKEVRFTTLNFPRGKGASQIVLTRAAQRDYDVYEGCLAKLVSANVLQEVTKEPLNTNLIASTSLNISGGAKTPKIYKINRAATTKDYTSILKILTPEELE